MKNAIVCYFCSKLRPESESKWLQIADDERVRICNACTKPSAHKAKTRTRKPKRSVIEAIADGRGIPSSQDEVIFHNEEVQS